MTEKTQANDQPEKSQEELEFLDREEVENKHLGIAGRIACNFIDSPISPLLMVATLFIGLLGLMFTPRQEDPQISVPMIDISWPGDSNGALPGRSAFGAIHRKSPRQDQVQPGQDATGCFDAAGKTQGCR
jgi:hypothetical protein